MKVIRLNGQKPRFFQILLRNTLKLSSTLMLGIGHFWVLFSRKKQGLHDYFSGSLVVVKCHQKDDDSYPRWY
jgi:uncharacterized RDD family membrane protein YckC